MITSRRRCARNAFLCSAAAAAIALAAPHGAWAGSAALPTGGAVQSGQAVIAASGPSALTISQSSKAAIIDWSSFSIGQGGSVQFNNGSGATLNRVLAGGPISTIDGRLSATGSVYLINPSGVIIGKDGVVKVGGTFAASTLDVDDGAFLNGGALTFSGQSKASVVNLGKVEALGGDVVLAAAMVKNAGTLRAPDGEVGLLAGYTVTLKDQADQNGLFTVQIGGAGTSVTNQGLIAATTAELRANGGNIYALAGDTASVIKATQVTHQGGQIFLTAPGGTVSVASGVTLDASATGSGDGGHILVDSASTSFHGTALARGGALGGDGGLVETSGGALDFSGAKVVTTAAHGVTGTWLLDPYDLTVNPAGATAIENGLATSNVTVETTGAQNPAFGVINPTGSGDITIAAPISWSSGHTLTLDAWHSLHVDAAITVAGGGGVVIKTNDGGSGGDYDFGLTSTGFSGAISYTGGASSGASLTINGTPYTLLYSMSDVQSINNNLGGNFALATSLNASTVASWAPIGTDGAGHVLGSNGFSGAFTGLGHTISNLTVDLSPTTAVYVGLFGYSSGTIRDIGVVGGSVSGKSYVGGLLGNEEGGTISDAFATGTVSAGGYYAGGLVGAAYGAITNAFATGAVSAAGAGPGGGGYAGGLVGFQTGGAISNAYATGAVTSAEGDAGGLVGMSAGAISNAYATGAVSGGMNVGGLVGYQGGGSITNAFATGTVTGAGGYVGGLVGYQDGGSITDAHATGAVNGGGYVGGLVGFQDGGSITSAYATGTVSGGGGAYVGGLVGDLTGDGTITNAYAIGAVSGGQYVGGLVGYQDVNTIITDAYATGAVSGSVNSVGGLVGLSLGGTITNAYATGAVSGGGYVGGLVGFQDGSSISNAYATGAVSGSGNGVGGLIGDQNGGSLTAAYATGAVSGGEYVGGLVGYSSGSITDAYATGAVSGSSQVGGLVGYQIAATINNAFATGAVTGGGYVGGLVGYLDQGTISNAYAAGAVSGGGSSVVGGLVGGNSGGGWIANAYATGAVSGAVTGGLVASNAGLVTNGWYDTQTTGQTSDGGGARGLTTRQMQGLDPISGSTYFSLAANLGDSTGATWGGGANGLYPYLKSFFPNGVQAVSGYAYTNTGGTVAASGANGAVSVGLDAGGSQVGQASTGANGYYYIITPAGTVASGQGLVVYTTADSATGAANAASNVESATGGSGVAASGLNLYGGWLMQQGGAADTTLSGLNSLYAGTIGSTAPSTFNLANRAIDVAAPSFTLDAPIALSGTLSLSSAGTVDQSAGLSVGALQLSGGGAFTLTDASNQIATLAAATGSLTLADGESLTVGSASGATGMSLSGVASTGAVNISTAGSLAIASGASVSAGSGDDVALAAGDAFINQAGATAVSVSGGGRWLIYSSAPGADVFGGLNSNNTAVWGTASGGSVSLSGNRYVFAYQPTLTVTTTSDSKTSGTDASSQIQADYTITGFEPGVAGAFLGDTAASAYSGAPSLASAGASANAAAGSYAITASLGALTSASGYAFKFADTGVLTVNPAAPSSPSGPSSPVAPQIPFEPANGANTSLFNTPTGNGGSGLDLLSEAGSDTTSNTQPSPGSNATPGGSGLPNGGSTPPASGQGQGSQVNAPYPDNRSYWGDIRFEGGIQ